MELSVILAGLGVIALVIVIPIHLLSSKYDKLMGAEHVSELSKLLGQLKAQALEKVGEELDEEAVKENAVKTSSGFAVLYTISPEEGGTHTHHLSISQNRSLVAHTAAMVMAAWFAKILSIDPAKIVVPLDIGDTGGTVRHIIFVLDGDEHEKYIESEVKELSVKQVEEFYPELDKLRQPIINNSLKRN